MSMDEAITYALATEEPEAPTARLGRRWTLTNREVEVAGLIAQGYSNRQIAAELVIAERTAETHVEHILSKLGLASRAQVAVWAIKHR